MSARHSSARTSLPRPLERDIQAAGVAALRAMGCWVEANGVSRGGAIRRSGFGRGSPDTLVIIPPLGVHLWIEWKRDAKSKRSPGQVEWHERAQRQGLNVATCCEVQQAIAAVLAVRRRVEEETT